jgi:DNA polymerase-3 subunit alpha
MAITDHGNMFGVKELYNYCNGVNKKRKEEGLEPFKPIFGCEMYVARHSMHDRNKANGDQSGNHLIVLAKNKQGYQNLIKLVSRSWTDGFYMKPRTDHSELEKYHEGLIICSACIAGEVPEKILKDDIEGARKAIEWFKNIFGDDYYLEIQRHEVKNPMIKANRETFPLQQKANREIIKLAKEYGIKIICSNDSHFVDEDNAEAHDHLLCLATGKDLDDPTRMLYTKQEWFKTREEMNEVFADIPEALANTCEVLDKVEFYGIDSAPIMPFFPIPKEFGTEEDTRQRITPEQLVQEFTTDENGNEIYTQEEKDAKVKKLGGVDKLYRIKFEADYLAKLAYDGAKRLYGDPLTQDVADRIKFELHIMKTMGFPGYFLIVQDFINSARDELGVMVGPGRGSAAGSVVAYCLGITKIDPMKYDLLFERFLNPDRISLPDIDTDFDDDGRGKVLEWVEDKYGHDNCAHIITYGTMATKNAIKDVARVEQVPLPEVNAICKAIPDKLPEVDGKTPKMNLPNAIKAVKELQMAEASADPRMSNTIKYAKMLEGTVRNTGIHACGFIICRDPISDHVPVSVVEDKNDAGHKLHCTQYDGHVIEETGLIKMDFLGLKTLSILKEAVENVRQTTGKTIDLDHIPIDDELTYKLYQEGNTIGTFQFESAGMQKYLRELHPTTFEDLIAMNALYRPGPMDYIPDFIKRKNDPSQVKYDIPCMEKYLKDTYGITVYQEQVMLLSRQLADFTRGQSDALRKAMGKKKKDIVDKMKPMFIEGGKKNGHDPKILEKIWADWEKFASYAFNKSHATCYSWVAFQTAYMKAHYPAEYMAAVMSRNISDITQITKLMAECKSMGIATLGPDVNESRLKFSVNSKGEIRFGLAGIKGMGDAAAQAIIDEREKRGPYKDVFDLVQRVNLSAANKKAFESLALSGGFDSFGIDRERYLANYDGANTPTFLEVLVRHGQLYQQEQAEVKNSLFGGEDAVEIKTPVFPKAEKWSSIERLNKERDLVGIYLSAHPLDEFRLVFDTMCNMTCPDIEDDEKLTTVEQFTFGGKVTASTERLSKNVKPYGVVVMEDFAGACKRYIFGNSWTSWRSWFATGERLFVTGKMYKRFPNSERYEFMITNVQRLTDTLRDLKISSITLNVEEAVFDDVFLQDMNTIFSNEQGETRLYFNVHCADGYLNLCSRNHEIKVTSELINYLKEHEIDYKLTR